MEVSVVQLIERWQNGLRVLQSMDPHEREKHFNMALWGRKTDCGTVACAAGHFSLDPWFVTLGFSSHWYAPDDPYLIPTLEADAGSWGTMIRTFFGADDRLDDVWNFEQAPELDQRAYRAAQIFYRDRASYHEVVDHILRSIEGFQDYLKRNPVTPDPVS